MDLLQFLFPEDEPELRAISDTVARFGDRFTERTRSGNAPEFRRDDFSEMGKLGLCGMSVPEAGGGSQMPSLGIAGSLFALARAELGPAIYLSVHLMVARLIAAWSSRHEALLQDLAAGARLGAFCLTEAHAGSDAAALRTSAARRGSDYVLSGEKIYITSGGVADTYLVFARTGADPKKGISAFVVHAGNPGLELGPAEKKMGCESAPICSVRFSDCVVPERDRIGEEGGGYKIALSGLAGGRVSIAAAACGLASRSLGLALEHLQERSQFGRRLAEFQGLQFMVADMAMQLRAAVLTTRHAAERLDQGSGDAVGASIAKCFSTDAAMRITTDGVQLLGGAGYLADYTVERLMRDAKMLQIVEGTNQIQRALIARALFDLRGPAPEAA